MFEWTKNRYFTSILWIGNPLGAFKDKQISAKSVGRTSYKKFLILLITHFQSRNYDKQSVKPSSYR